MASVMKLAKPSNSMALLSSTTPSPSVYLSGPQWLHNNQFPHITLQSHLVTQAHGNRPWRNTVQQCNVMWMGLTTRLPHPFTRIMKENGLMVTWYRLVFFSLLFVVCVASWLSQSWSRWIYFERGGLLCTAQWYAVIEGKGRGLMTRLTGTD